MVAEEVSQLTSYRGLYHTILQKVRTMSKQEVEMERCVAWVQETTNFYLGYQPIYDPQKNSK